jgi:hypothetical protein
VFLIQGIITRVLITDLHIYPREVPRILLRFNDLELSRKIL